MRFDARVNRSLAESAEKASRVWTRVGRGLVMAGVDVWCALSATIRFIIPFGPAIHTGVVLV